MSQNIESAETPEEWVLAALQEATDPIPEGQNVQSPLWTSEGRLKSSGEKFSSEYPKDRIESALARLRATEKVFTWHGLICPADPEHLRAVIEAERKADVTRKLLVGKCNRVIQEQQSENKGEHA